MEQQIQMKNRKKRRPCPFCVDQVTAIDYKSADRLRRFITERGKIVPRRNSAVCARHQRMLATSIKRARFMGIIPYCMD